MKLPLVSLALVAAATPLVAQKLPGGYVSSSLRNLPVAAAQTLHLDGKTVVYFTGTDLVRDDGTNQTKLLSFTSAVYGSFTIRVDASTLLFGENSGGGIWRVPLDTKIAPKKLNTLSYNYSAAMYDGRWAIVSAKTGGFSSKKNELVAIDVVAGTLDPIASVGGASGPVATDGHGNIYYATASNSYPPPKGSSSVLRFGASKVATAFGSTTLAETDADPVYKGLDSASAMAMDDDHDLFVADWVNNVIVEIDEIHSAQPKAKTFASYTGAVVVASDVQFAPGTHWGLGNQQFEPYQPADSGALRIHETAYGTTSRIRTLAPARPRMALDTSSPVPIAKRFNLDVLGGPASATAFFAIGGGHSSREVSVQLRAEPPIFWSSALLAPALLFQVALDSNGALRQPMINPGFGKIPVTAQLFFESKDGRTAGSCAPLSFVLD